MSMDAIRAAKQRAENRTIAGGIIAAIGFLSFLPSGASGGGFVVIAMAMFLGGGILMGYAGSTFKKDVKALKERLIAEALAAFSPDVRYLADYGFTEEEVVSSLLLYRQDRFKSEDSLSGTIAGVRFLSSDVRQEEVHTDSKGHTHTTVVFLGRVYLFEFPVPFPTDLLIRQPGLFGSFGMGTSGFEKVETESIDFNKELCVYAKDPLSAFEVLLPQVMERFRHLDAKYADKIGFSFSGKRLWVTVNSGIDAFEIRLFRPLPETFLPDLQDEIGTVTDVIRAVRKEGPAA